MIQAENIHKSYGSLHVLKGLQPTVQAGEVISIMGSMSGKKHLAGYHWHPGSPDSGTCRGAGQGSAGSFQPRNLPGFENKRIGFVHSVSPICLEFSFENVHNSRK